MGLSMPLQANPAQLSGSSTTAGNDSRFNKYSARALQVQRAEQRAIGYGFILDPADFFFKRFMHKSQGSSATA